jgi:hypothetical protein
MIYYLLNVNFSTEQVALPADDTKITQGGDLILDAYQKV